MLAAALLLRWRLEWLLWASLALGLAVQALFLVGDAFATRISVPWLKPPNPYARTLGWNAYAQAIGGLAEKIGAPTIAAEERADVAALLYYRRHSPQTILAWPSSETPKFEMSRALTAQAREPVLFVTYCRDPQRLAPYFRKVEPLGEFATVGRGAALLHRVPAGGSARTHRAVARLRKALKHGISAISKYSIISLMRITEPDAAPDGTSDRPAN